MKYFVDEVQGEDGKIAIGLKGEGISFMATGYAVTIYVDEKTADSIAFHIGSILQDRERRKDLTLK